MIRVPRTLVLSDGGLVSLIACVAAREAVLAAVPAIGGHDSPTTRPLVVPATFSASTSRAQTESIARQCEALDLELAGVSTSLLPEGDADSPECHTRDLVRAGYAAIRHECPLVIWPIQFDQADIGSVSDAVDRALLIGRILTIDSPGSPIKIDAAYADLNDRHVADLVLDMDVPAHLCWWWHAELADGSIHGARDRFIREHRRWTSALTQAGWRAPF